MASIMNVIRQNVQDRQTLINISEGVQRLSNLPERAPRETAAAADG